MKSRLTLLLLPIFFIVFMIPLAYAHAEDEQDMGSMAMDSSDMAMGAGGYHFMYYGKISFPAWTYYAEIILHFVSLLVAVGAVLLIYYELRKSHGHIRKTLDYALLGFSLIAFGELMTTLHHFLIYPFGVLNAIINHGLLLIGLLCLVYAFFVLKDKKSGRRS